MPHFKNPLSVKLASLTAILTLMTVVIGGIAIISVENFKTKYEEIKENQLLNLLKTNELRAQTDEVLRWSTEMFLAEDKHQIQWLALEITDSTLWIDKLLLQLEGKVAQHDELTAFKARLYEHSEAVKNTMIDKYNLSTQFFVQYERAEAYKKLQVLNNNNKMIAIIDTTMAHFNPIVNPQLTSPLGVNIDEYILPLQNQLTPQESIEFSALFLGSDGLYPLHTDYLALTKRLHYLRVDNKEINELMVSVMGASMLLIQSQFYKNSSEMEENIANRRLQLYSMLFTFLITVVILLILQFGFLRRVRLIQQVINASESNTLQDISIKGNDEISAMASSVKNYLEQLSYKEREILETNSKLKHLATHDPLTNIYNRRHFDELFQYEHSRYLRYQGTYCLAMIDLDFFKLINDEYGHSGGDQVLVNFTLQVINEIRETDIFSRIGGEEFSLLMPHTTIDDAAKLMERIRASIQQSPCLQDGAKINYTVSAGVVEVKSEHEASTLLKFADMALYDAKQTGRNKVCIYKR